MIRPGSSDLVLRGVNWSEAVSRQGHFSCYGQADNPGPDNNAVYVVAHRTVLKALFRPKCGEALLPGQAYGSP
jgi:hypothetical protein